MDGNVKRVDRGNGLSQMQLTHQNLCWLLVTLYLGGSDPKVTLTLTDLDGRKLINKTYEIPENRELRVALDGLSTGLYVLRLSSDSLRSEHKLIKQ